MRGTDERAGSLFSYVDLESRIPPRHPLRAILAIVNDALSTLDADFAGLYSRIGRPSIPPEQLLRAMLLQLFYAIRSERLLVERLDFDRTPTRKAAGISARARADGLMMPELR